MQRTALGWLVSLTLLIGSAPSHASDFFLHTSTTDFLDYTSPAAAAAKFKDSPAINRTTYQPIGTWTAAPLTSAMQLNALSDLRAWIGLKNTDDQGTYFDLRAELRKNGAPIASGETKTIQGVTRNASSAKEVLVSFGAVSEKFSSGDVLSLRVLTKVAASGGHNNATGLRLYYDAVSRPSRFGGTFAPSSPSLQVTITSPAAASTLDTFSTLVKGEIALPMGTEVGVTVNGFAALLHNGQFATTIPVDQTVSTLTATATDPDGVTLASHSIPVTVQPQATEPVLLFRPSPVLGAAPLTATFTLTSLKPVANIALDANGDGTIDFNLPSLDGQTFVYNASGLYFPKVTVTDNTGSLHVAEAMLQVVDSTALDNLLQGKWNAMKDALRSGNVSLALTYIVSSRRSNYQAMFNALTVPLSSIDQILTAVTFVKQSGLDIEYRMTHMEGSMQFSDLVLFTLDLDGVWRIKFF